VPLDVVARRVRPEKGVLHVAGKRQHRLDR
jgi:hypothetical protein